MTWAWLSDFLQIFADLIPRPLIVRTDERTIEFVCGKWPRQLEPGWYVKWPAIAAYEDVPVKLQITSRQQRFGDKSYRWKVVYTICDPLKLVTETYDSEETIADLVEIAFGDCHRNNPEKDLTSPEIRKIIRRRIKAELSELGVDVTKFSVSSWATADFQLSIWELQTPESIAD